MKVTMINKMIADANGIETLEIVNALVRLEKSITADEYRTIRTNWYRKAFELGISTDWVY